MALGKGWAISLIVSILFLGALTPGLMFEQSFAQSGGTDKITICHYPPGNPQNPQTITVSIKSLQAHSGHGDTIGPCVVQQCPDSDGDGACDQVCVGEDICPTDPRKTEPGICGCGLADDDSDGDGAADCIDVCINDPSNDADQDGFCPSDGDCDDQNPNSFPRNSEVCDGLDNDCDGAIDDGNPGGGAQCTTQLPGVCSAGTTSCQAGVLVCNQTTQPFPEVCNGSDDDCNGTIDEGCICRQGETRSCGTDVGACELGTQTCVDGQFGACIGGVGPSSEVCDQLDNDCDGAADEGETCGVSSCFAQPNGTPCNDGLFCTVGETCVNEVCFPSPRDCDDNDSSTVDACDELADMCVNTPISNLEIDHFPSSTFQFRTDFQFGEIITLHGSSDFKSTFPSGIGSATDTDGDGLEQVPTEILALGLTGSGPNFPDIILRTQGLLRPSLGEIEENSNNNLGTLDVSPFAPGTADSFYDLFIIMEISGLEVHNQIPIHLQATVNEKPAGVGDTFTSSQTIQLLGDSGLAFTISDIVYIPEPGT